MFNTNARIQKLEDENVELQRKLSCVKDELRLNIQSNRMHATENQKLRQELQMAKDEAEKFQKINDELIDRMVNHVRKESTNEYKTALEIKDRELEQQAKYAAELRSYVSSLQSKVRDLNSEVQHHKEKHTELQVLLDKERNRHKSTFDLQREKAILDNRVSVLYDAIEEIKEIAADVI
ncbi:hypothetical protein BVL54_19855 [Bacillus paralicheniformis]|nr:hypothetical protein BVL54_19855 [Bacillus paralicheniformis]